MLKKLRGKFSTCQDLILVQGACCVIASYCTTSGAWVRISIQLMTTGPCCELPRSETCRNVSTVQRINTAHSKTDAPVKENFCSFSLVSLSQPVSAEEPHSQQVTFLLV